MSNPKSNCWKVINKNTRKSCLTSLPGWLVLYPVNKTAHPLVKKSKLFVFRTRKEARFFTQGRRGMKVCHARGTNLTNTRIMSSVICQETLRHFWAGTLTIYSHTSTPPIGTLWADTVRCLD